jgi:hypothetical protein
MRAAALAIICVTTLVLSGCGGGGSHEPTEHSSSGPAVPQLRNIDQLRAAFNAHSGVPRLIVLLSPT